MDLWYLLCTTADELEVCLKGEKGIEERKKSYLPEGAVLHI